MCVSLCVHMFWHWRGLWPLAWSLTSRTALRKMGCIMESLLETTPRNSSSSFTSHASEGGDWKEGRMRRAWAGVGWCVWCWLRFGGCMCVGVGGMGLVGRDGPSIYTIMTTHVCVCPHTILWK